MKLIQLSAFISTSDCSSVHQECRRNLGRISAPDTFNAHDRPVVSVSSREVPILHKFARNFDPSDLTTLNPARLSNWALDKPIESSAGSEVGDAKVAVATVYSIFELEDS
jgi:hypothetical protein